MNIKLKTKVFNNFPTTKRSIGKGFFTIVPQSHIYYREFLGRSRVRLEPGVRINLPFFHQLHVVDLKEEGVKITEIHCYTNDNVPVTVGGFLFYKVTDAEKACFSITNYKESILAVGESAMRSIVGRLQYDEIIKQRNEINDQLVQNIGHTIENWGVNATRFEINDFKPNNSSVQKQLELQLESERKRRANELETQTKIRTSEGEKQSAILLSEAELISKKNSADGDKYMIDVKTKALAEQIKTLKEVCGSAELAINFILESKRIEEFGKLHSSNNKEIYFCDPKGIVPNSKIAGDMIDMNKKI